MSTCVAANGDAAAAAAVPQFPAVVGAGGSTVGDQVRPGASLGQRVRGHPAYLSQVRCPRRVTPWQVCKTGPPVPYNQSQTHRNVLIVGDSVRPSPPPARAEHPTPPPRPARLACAARRAAAVGRKGAAVLKVRASACAVEMSAGPSLLDCGCSPRSHHDNRRLSLVRSRSDTRRTWQKCSRARRSCSTLPGARAPGRPTIVHNFFPF